MPGFSTLRRRLRPGSTPCVVVLLYHRIAETPSDPWQLSVRPEHFVEQLRVLENAADVISADDMVRALETGRLPRRAVVVTFDDGYADNLLTAKPLLDRVDLPATIFLASGAVDSPHEFWWDELERIFLRPGTLPSSLELEICGRPRAWSFGPDAVWSVAEWEGRCAWLATTPPQGVRQQAYFEIWSALRVLPAWTQQEVLDRLAEWSGSPRLARPSHRALTALEARQLASGNRFQIGAHTVSHPSLPAHSRQAQQEEIRASKEHVEALLGDGVRHFSYPYGDYSQETSVLVREAGFASAFTVDEGVVRHDSARWRLPRHKVEDWGADEFAKRLEAMFQAPSGGSA